MSSGIDILHYDSLVKNYFITEKKNLLNYKRKLDEIKDILDKNVLLPNEKDKLLSEVEQLDKKIKDITYDTSYSFYHMESDAIISEYKASLNKPVSFSFLKKTHDKTPIMSQDKYNSYIDIVKKYTPIQVLYVSPDETKRVCPNCSIKNLDSHYDKYECSGCGYTESKLLSDITYRDNDRVGSSVKFRYIREVHFKDKVKQYQGKENDTIPDKVHNDVKRWVINNCLPYKKQSEVEVDEIKQALEETGNNKYYQNKVKIWMKLTGNTGNDLSDIEDLLIEEHRSLNDLYDNDPEIIAMKDGRTSFLNSDYVLTQLLARHGHKYLNEPDFLKTGERLSFHNNICRRMFDKLNWTFSPL